MDVRQIGMRADLALGIDRGGTAGSQRNGGGGAEKQRWCSCPVLHGDDPMSIDQLPAHPAGDQQDQHGQRRQDQAGRHH